MKFFTGLDRPCLDQSGTTSNQLLQCATPATINTSKKPGFTRGYQKTQMVKKVSRFSSKGTEKGKGTSLCGKTFTRKTEFAMHIAHSQWSRLLGIRSGIAAGKTTN